MSVVKSELTQYNNQELKNKDKISKLQSLNTDLSQQISAHQDSMTHLNQSVNESFRNYTA